MPETYGKGQCITYLGRTSSGSSTPIWKSWLASTRRRGMCFHDGWSGALARKPGWLLSNLKKEWDSLKMRKLFFIVTCRHILILILISRLPSSSSEIGTVRLLEASMRELSPSLAQKPFRKTTSFSLRSLKSKTDSMTEPGKFSNSDWGMSRKIKLRNSMRCTSTLRSSTVPKKKSIR